jgi:hypothetical protein
MHLVFTFQPLNSPATLLAILCFYASIVRAPISPSSLVDIHRGFKGIWVARYDSLAGVLTRLEGS